MRKVLTICTAAAWMIAASEASRPVSAGATPEAPMQAPVPAAAANPARALVSTYCIACHNDRLKTANLSLEKADADDVFSAAETWEKVVVKLRSRAMPPPGIRRPDNATYDAAAQALEAALDRAAAAHPNPGRPGDLHRLNRTEYANAVRDLLGVPIDPQAMLPPDTQAFGFVGSSRVDLQACKLEYSIVSPK